MKVLNFILNEPYVNYIIITLDLAYKHFFINFI